MEPPAARPVRLRVASYNVRKCIGLDRRRVPERVLAVVNDLDADVVALQEADRRLGQRPTALPPGMITELTDFVPADLAENDVSLGWHGNAVLVRKGLVIGDTVRLELPSFEPRGAGMVDLEHDGHPVRIVATHLGLTRRHRRQQLEAITDDLSGRDPRPTIIMGDFNEWSHQRGLEPLEDGFVVHAPGRSFHAARPVAALDRFAASPGLKLVNSGVYRRGAALLASDHLPVWADFVHV